MNIDRKVFEQEPVAWMTRRTGDGGAYVDGYESCEPTDYGAFPVYPAPPKREWVGLTDEEIARVVSLAGFAPDWAEANIATQIVRVCQDMLKRKNT